MDSNATTPSAGSRRMNPYMVKVWARCEILFWQYIMTLIEDEHLIWEAAGMDCKSDPKDLAAFALAKRVVGDLRMLMLSPDINVARLTSRIDRQVLEPLQRSLVMLRGASTFTDGKDDILVDEVDQYTMISEERYELKKASRPLLERARISDLEAVGAEKCYVNILVRLLHADKTDRSKPQDGGKGQSPMFSNPLLLIIPLMEMFETMHREFQMSTCFGDKGRDHRFSTWFIKEVMPYEPHEKFFSEYCSLVDDFSAGQKTQRSWEDEDVYEDKIMDAKAADFLRRLEDVGEDEWSTDFTTAVTDLLSGMSRLSMRARGYY